IQFPGLRARVGRVEVDLYTVRIKFERQSNRLFYLITRLRWITNHVVSISTDAQFPCPAKYLTAEPGPGAVSGLLVHGFYNSFAARLHADSEHDAARLLHKCQHVVVEFV